MSELDLTLVSMLFEVMVEKAAAGNEKLMRACGLGAFVAKGKSMGILGMIALLVFDFSVFMVWAISTAFPIAL